MMMIKYNRLILVYHWHNLAKIYLIETDFNPEKKSCSWNAKGNALMFENIPFPIVVISNSEDMTFIVEKVRN